MQGCLASMKVRNWWIIQSGYRTKNRYDYIAALTAHGISWSFCIMLPICIAFKFAIPWWVRTIFFVNIFLHCYIDDEKANKGTLSLLQDQVIHYVQIFCTWFIYVVSQAV